MSAIWTYSHMDEILDEHPPNDGFFLSDYLSGFLGFYGESANADRIAINHQSIEQC